MLIWWRVGGRNRGFSSRGFSGRGFRDMGRILARHSSQGDDGGIAPIFNVADPVSQMMMHRVRSLMPVVSAILIVMVTVAGQPSKETKAENHGCFRLRLGEECQAQNSKGKISSSLHIRR